LAVQHVGTRNNTYCSTESNNDIGLLDQMVEMIFLKALKVPLSIGALLGFGCYSEWKRR
jgi:hypothetical protein